MPKMRSNAGAAAGLGLGYAVVDDAITSPIGSQAEKTSADTGRRSSHYLGPASLKQLIEPRSSTQTEVDGPGSAPRRADCRVAFNDPCGAIPDHQGSARHNASRLPTRGGLTPGTLRRVRAYIEANLEGRIELADLAAVANLSRTYFASAFKKSIGSTPHRYVMLCRLAKARLFLAMSNLAIVEIALTTGFADQSHFSRCFRAFFGLSPLTFRRSQMPDGRAEQNTAIVATCASCGVSSWRASGLPRPHAVRKT